MAPFLILIVLIFFVMRPLVGKFSFMGKEVYKDFAHLVVGGFFGAWFATYSLEVETHTALYGSLALMLTIWEVVCFVMSKKGMLPK